MGKVIVESLRELDELVAMHVFEIGPQGFLSTPHLYSSSFNDARMVLQELKLSVVVVDEECAKYHVGIFGDSYGHLDGYATSDGCVDGWMDHVAIHDDLAIAICLSALKAKGVEVDLQIKDGE